MRVFAQELVGLQPDIIMTIGTPATIAVQRETRTIAIVFAGPADPVASGIVARLDRPSGNVTGFALAGRQMARAALGDRARPKARRNQLAAEKFCARGATLSKPAAGRSEPESNTRWKVAGTGGRAPGSGEPAPNRPATNASTMAAVR
jgi:hypothetical protein